MLNKESLGLISYYMRAYPRRSVLMVTCLLLAGFLEGVGIATLLPILDVLSEETSKHSVLTVAITRFLGFFSLRPTLGTLLFIMIVGMSFKAASLWLAMRQVGYTIAHVAAALRLSLIHALMKARWTYFSSHPAGRFAHAISIEAFRASNAYYEVAIGIACAVQMLVYAFAAVLISWQITLLALVFGSGMIFALRGLIKMTRAASFEQNEIGKSLVVRLTDALQGIKPIKAMAREDQLVPLLEAETQDLNRSQRRVILSKETLNALQEPLMLVSLALGVYAAIRWMEMPLSSLMVLAFLFYRLTTRSNMMQQAYQKIAMYEASFWSFRNGVTLAESEKEATDGLTAPPPLKKGIEFASVYFGYNPEKPILKGVSFFVPADRFVAIEGPSGAGKTTIADMIIGLTRPQSGSVYVDEIALKDIDLYKWRRMIGYVPQEMFLFHESVYRNITLSDATISREAVEHALRAAGAWIFVSALPDGMDTVLGERGSRISGGERQRIALARALVCKPRLLILDEVTTALDPKTEEGICSTLSELSKQVTIVAISHQPAVTNAAHLVYRLEDGRIRQK